MGLQMSDCRGGDHGTSCWFPEQRIAASVDSGAGFRRPRIDIGILDLPEVAVQHTQIRLGSIWASNIAAEKRDRRCR